MKYLTTFLISYFVMVILMPSLIKFLTRLKIVDLPDERKLHDIPVPRMGGILIFLIIISFLIYYSSEIENVWLIIASSALLAICGIIDDVFGLNWFYKFMFQISAVVLTIFYIIPEFNELVFFGIVIPSPIDIILLTFFVLGIINSLNMIDGMDGLLSGFALLLLFTLLLISAELGNSIKLLIITSALGATAGFLIFNLRPAKIFLGDTGSLVLGYFIAFVSVLISIDSSKKIIDLTFAHILLAVPIVDTLKVMAVRIINGKNPFLPDKLHLHHIILGNNINYRATVFIIHIFTVIFILSALVYYKYSDIVGVILFFSFSVLILLVKLFFRTLSRVKILNGGSFFPAESISKITGFNKNIYFVISLAVISIIIVIFYPYDLILRQDIKIIILLSLLMLLALSIIRMKHSPIYRDFYFFVNLGIFMILSCNSQSLFIDYIYAQFRIAVTLLTLLAILIFTFTILMLLKTKSISEIKSRFNVKDLLVFLHIILLLSINYIYDLNLPKLFMLKLFFAFIIYLWYRVLTYYNENYKDVLFFLSFLLPLSVLLLNL